jgi:hypothetical protein
LRKQSAARIDHQHHDAKQQKGVAIGQDKGFPLQRAGDQSRRGPRGDVCFKEARGEYLRKRPDPLPTNRPHNVNQRCDPWNLTQRDVFSDQHHDPTVDLGADWRRIRAQIGVVGALIGQARDPAPLTERNDDGKSDTADEDGGAGEVDQGPARLLPLRAGRGVL